jgi:uncharacterized protein YdaU (DUF1376 family)
MHYFQFNIGDYASHTRHLTPMEDLVYRRLLDLYYLKDGQVYGDEAEVARQIGLREYVQEVTQVLQDFFCIGEEDRWTHDRCDAEIAKFREKSEKASNAGKASAQRRSNGRSTDVQPTNNQEPITNNQDIIHSYECMSETPVSDEPSLKVEDVVEVWNEMAEQCGLAKVTKLTDVRRKKIKARIKEYSVEDWSKAMKAIYNSKFLRGENDRGWKADFDFLLEPSKFVKLVEGAYDR